MVNRPVEISGKFAAADDDIAAYEFSRSRAQQIHNQDWQPLGIPAVSDGHETWERALQGEITTPLFLNDPSARTATLGILRLGGDWDAADAMQERLVGPDSVFVNSPYNSEVFSADSEEAKRRVAIDWGVTSVRGLTMITRRRRLLQTGPFTEELQMTGTTMRYEAHSHVEVDKLSTFALDIDRLADIDHEAAQEVRLIIICGILASSDLRRVYRATKGEANWDDKTATAQQGLREGVINVATARFKMRHYNISADAVVDRYDSENPTWVRRPETIQAIETEVKDRTGLLVPSTATFYGARVLNMLRRV
ncbi:MAG TPA: hypothetical protein VJM32_06285 [Candidatus Saccharimonadales bacterium]|nr:hypothetical protein [Candidatus Saccharimonadales bacterium]